MALRIFFASKKPKKFRKLEGELKYLALYGMKFWAVFCVSSLVNLCILLVVCAQEHVSAELDSSSNLSMFSVCCFAGEVSVS